MSEYKRIIGQIVADHGGISHATPERIGRIIAGNFNRVDLLKALVDSIGDWFMWTTDDKSNFIVEARKQWSPRSL